tara:strand:- start:190 stop:405 length:216 start_codon:yes stop_codon:yes gene_type:complete
LFLLKIEIKSFFTISRCSSVFFSVSVSLSFSSLSKDCLALSKLSIKFKDSFAKEKPPYSKASSFSFSNLLL